MLMDIFFCQNKPFLDGNHQTPQQPPLGPPASGNSFTRQGTHLQGIWSHPMGQTDGDRSPGSKALQSTHPQSIIFLERKKNNNLGSLFWLKFLSMIFCCCCFPESGWKLPVSPKVSSHGRNLWVAHKEHLSSCFSCSHLMEVDEVSLLELNWNGFLGNKLLFRGLFRGRKA